MRKILICLVGAIILSNCEISVKKSNAQETYGTYGYVTVTIKEYTIDGMKYVAFIGTGKYENSMSVVNVTRDKLQCEIITKNLKNIKDGKSND